MKLTIKRMKELNAPTGQKWFNPDTMRFFNCKIRAPFNVSGRWFFLISTEIRKGLKSDPHCPQWSLCEFLDNGCVSTIILDLNEAAPNLVQRLKSGHIPSELMSQ